jgi:hypothetical protein
MRVMSACSQTITLLLLLLLVCETVFGKTEELRPQFHAYEVGGKNQHADEPQCRDHVTKHAQSNTQALVTKYKLWPGLIKPEHVLTPDSTLFGFGEALDIIWKHQHPEDCSTAKFFISGNHNGGFGSELHVQSSALGVAMNMGRVYLQNTESFETVEWEFSNSHCQTQNKTNLECYYEPWSSCTIFDALGPNAVSILRNAREMNYPEDHAQIPSFMWTGDIHQMENPNVLQAFNKKFENNKVVTLKNMARLGNGGLPNILLPIVQCSPMVSFANYYWWRAVSTSFTMRPNAATLNWMNSHALTEFDSHAENAIGVYVRRGDKEIEMRIAPLPEYWDAMHMLWKNGYLNHTGSAHHDKKVVFLASEDSKVIDDMVKWSEKHGIAMEYTKVFDRHGLFAEMSPRERSTGKPAAHHPEEYLSMMLNVHYLLKSTAWVCTMASNFCRVFDELRATVAAKADHPYVDLSVETCAHPPCVYTPLKYFDWR